MIRALQPVAARDQFRGRHRGQRRQPGGAERGLEPGVRRVSAAGTAGRTSGSTTGRARPDPAPLPPARGLLLGKDDQAVVGRHRAGPGGQVVGAAHAVPDRDPSADPLRLQAVLDLVGAKPRGRAPIGCPQVGMLLDLEPERLQRLEVVPDPSRGPGPGRPGDELPPRRGAGPAGPCSASPDRRGSRTRSHFRFRPDRAAGRLLGSHQAGGSSKSRAMSSAGAEWVSARR